MVKFRRGEVHTGGRKFNFANDAILSRNFFLEKLFFKKIPEKFVPKFFLFSELLDSQSK